MRDSLLTRAVPFFYVEAFLHRCQNSSARDLSEFDDIQLPRQRGRTDSVRPQCPLAPKVHRADCLTSGPLSHSIGARAERQTDPLMHFESTSISGVVVVESRVFADERGFFVETYQQERFVDAGVDATFVQDNHSHSQTGVLRGLHYQIQQPQGKLVSVVRGEIYDVAVDLRRSSPTFGQWFGIHLGGEPHKMLYVPPGCAHGFLVTDGPADVCYKCTDLYAPQHERTLLWNDSALGIGWPLSGPPIVSSKDQNGVLLSSAETYP